MEYAVVINDIHGVCNSMSTIPAVIGGGRGGRDTTSIHN